MMHALVHTQGVVLGNTYLPLEIAYRDVLGGHAHLLITSPLNYSKMKRLYPNASPDVLVTTVHGVAYSEVLRFLKLRFQILASTFPATTPILFGYKGNSYQPRVLLDAGIPNRVNVEDFGVPALLPTTDRTCPWHKGNRRKCALAALEQILSHAR